MTPSSHPHSIRRTGEELTTSTVFELLSDRHRRLALYCLAERVDAISLPDLARDIARRDGREQVEQISTALRHSHLPKLDEADVVRYEPEVDRILPQPAITRLQPYLELARAEDS